MTAKRHELGGYGDLIRAAYKARRKVTIDGKEYNIRLRSKPVAFSTKSGSHVKVERWLIATRTNGDLLPTFSVEAEAGGNLRSSVA